MVVIFNGIKKKKDTTSKVFLSSTTISHQIQLRKWCVSIITISLNKINGFDKKIESINDYIKIYNNYRDNNNFSNLKCPLCKSNALKFHKTYERNITYYIEGKLENIKIDIIVCICEHCAKKEDIQKYHAILTEFILPYSIYEASTIIKAINDYINKVKLIDILERLKIQHKQFYDWLKKINKYGLSSSIILKVNNNIKDIINEIIKEKDKFLINFYNNYYHPFFLFRITCVPLCITP